VAAYRGRLFVGLTVLVGWLLTAWPAHAIPAFARRYETSCSTCHTQFPNLNAFGEAFRRNGYQFPGGADAEQIKQTPLTLVSDARRALFPHSDWPTDLARFPPLALVLNGVVPIYPDAATRPPGAKTLSFDDMFAQAQLFLGARAGDHVAVFAGIDLNSDADVEFERGFIVFSDLIPAAGAGGLLNVRIGQFEPQIFSFSDYRRIGGPTYQILEEPLAPAQFSLEPYVRGIDLSGTIAGRFEWNAAWVQGEEESNYEGSRVPQAPKDGYAHIVTRFGGPRLDGIEPGSGAPGASPRGDSSVDLGAFVYAGDHDVETDPDGDAPVQRDFVLKVGGDALARLGNVSALFALAYERHDYQLDPTLTRFQSLGEVTWRPYPWLALVARGEGEAGSSGTTRRFVPIVSAHPRINLKFQTYAIIEDVKSAGAAYHVDEIDVGASYAF
jgi:hypothetical protein